MKAQQKKSKSLPWVIQSWYWALAILIVLLFTVLSLLSIPSWIWYVPLIALGAPLLLFLFREARQKIPWKKISWGSSGSTATKKSTVSPSDVLLVTVFVLVIILIPKGWDYVSKNGKSLFETNSKNTSTVTTPLPAKEVRRAPLQPSTKKRVGLFSRKVLTSGTNHLKKGARYYFTRDNKKDLIVQLVKDGRVILTYQKDGEPSVHWDAINTCVDGFTSVELAGNTSGDGGNYFVTSNQDVSIRVSYKYYP